MADFYEVLNEDGTTELVPVEGNQLQSGEEARAWWQFAPTDTPSVALNKLGAAGLQGLPFGEELAARADVLGQKIGSLLGGSPAEMDVASQQQSYREQAKEAEREAYGKAIAGQVLANVPSLAGGLVAAGAKKAGSYIPTIGQMILERPYVSGALGGSLTGAGLAEPSEQASPLESVSQRLPSAVFGAGVGAAAPAVVGAALNTAGYLAKTRPAQALLEAGQDVLSPIITALKGAAPETAEQAQELIRQQMGAVGNLPTKGKAGLSTMEKATAQQLAKRGFDPEQALKAQQEAIAGGRPEQLLFESEYFPTQKTGAMDLADILAQRPAGAPIASEALMGRIGKKGFEGEQEVMRGRIGKILDKISPETQFEIGADQGQKALKSFKESVDAEVQARGGGAYLEMFKGEPSERLTKLMDERQAKEYFKDIITPAFPGDRYSQESAKKFVSHLKFIERTKDPSIAGAKDIKLAKRLRTAIEDELEALNPGYKAADAQYRALFEEISGLSEPERLRVENLILQSPDKVGSTLLNSTTSPQFVDKISKAVGSRLGEEGKKGLASALRVELERKGGEKGGTELVKAIRRGPATRKKIGSLVGEKTSQSIRQGLDQEVQMLESAGKILRGSRTGARAINDKELTTLTQAIYDTVTNFPRKMASLFMESQGGSLGLDDAAIREMSNIIYSSGPEAAQMIQKLSPYIKRLTNNQKGVDTLIEILKPQSSVVSKVASRTATEE